MRYLCLGSVIWVYHMLKLLIKPTPGAIIVWIDQALFLDVSKWTFDHTKWIHMADRGESSNTLKRDVLLPYAPPFTSFTMMQNCWSWKRAKLIFTCSYYQQRIAADDVVILTSCPLIMWMILTSCPLIMWMILTSCPLIMWMILTSCPLIMWMILTSCPLIMWMILTSCPLIMWMILTSCPLIMWWFLHRVLS